MSAPIYLDYNATTPVADDVLDAMLPFFRGHFGNPSSEHAYGWAADEAVAQARERTARVIGATPRTVVFTSGATESVSLAIRGAGGVYGGRRHRIVTAQTEHKAVLETCAAMEREGYEVTYLPVDGDGLVDPDAVRAAVTDETLMVSVMWANNETGVVQPVAEIAAAAREVGALVMIDATQAVGKVPVAVEDVKVDLLALSGHKLYGPKGVGALYVRQRGPRVRLQPQVTGGDQEAGHRAGTTNVPGVVGLGAAAALARRLQGDDAERLTRLRDRFEAAVRDAVPGTLRQRGRGAAAAEHVEPPVRGRPDVAPAAGHARRGRLDRRRVPGPDRPAQPRADGHGAHARPVVLDRPVQPGPPDDGGRGRRRRRLGRRGRPRRPPPRRRLVPRQVKSDRLLLCRVFRVACPELPTRNTVERTPQDPVDAALERPALTVRS